MTQPDVGAPQSSGGLIEDFIDVFVKPAALFERTRNAGFWRPVLIQTVLFLVLSVGLANLSQPFVNAEFNRGFAKAEAKAAAAGTPMPEGARAMGEKMASVSKYALPLLLPILTAVLGGLFLWVSAMIVGARTSYGTAATVASWSFTPALIGVLVMAILGMTMSADSIRGVTDAQIGPARFFDPNTASPVMMAVLQRLDLFSLWELVLCGIGISVVTKSSRGNGMTASVLRWGFVTLILVFAASRS